MNWSTQKGGKRCSARGWGKMAPKRGSQRDKMARRCGKKCFAGSLKARSYPVCRKGTCRVEDKGLCAALYYAQLLGHKRLTRKLKKAIAGRAKGTRKRGGATLQIPSTFGTWDPAEQKAFEYKKPMR